MQVRWDFWYDFGHWTTWVTLGVGFAFAFLVYLVLSRIKARRRQLAFANGDLPWEDLLQMLRARHRELEASGSPPQENLPPDELLALLLSQVPANRRCPTPEVQEVPPEELAYLTVGGENRRSSRRRWGNPTEVSLTSFLWPDNLHGLVINRSTGGLAIFVDREIEPTTTLTVRPLEAPNYVPSVEIEVKHCRKVRRNYIIGCQASMEIPWNVLAWFG